MRLFPRLWAGTFIEAVFGSAGKVDGDEFPRLWAGTFIEALRRVP